jgi:SAM-dependent methyltransferase
MGSMQRSEGRSLFGGDPAGYERARPDYPERVFELLRERCGLRAGTAVLEIGPGTGKATRRLLQLGAARPLVAVEPDPALAAHLRVAHGDAVEVVQAPFEEAVLPVLAFDLAVAATSFHWVEPTLGLARIGTLLRPGGAWAMWWALYGDESADHAFHDATQELLSGLPDPRPWAREPGRPWFALDVDRRRAELVDAGFVSVTHELIRRTERFDTARVRALYGTFSPISRLPAAERERLLDGIALVAEREFGGVVERPVLNVVYTARRPA